MLAGIGSIKIVTMLSLIIRELHRKAFELARTELGTATEPFCLFVTGSHGRMENLRTPDQGHGMILTNNHTDNVDHFKTLTLDFSNKLNEIGFV